jgi:thioredoxin-like negative regulator of GroEL
MLNSSVSISFVIAPHSLFTGVVRFAAVNCEANRELCGDRGVQSYPTVRATVPGGPDEEVEYNGERSAAKIKDWALSLLPNGLIASINRKSRMEAFLQDSCGGGGGRKKAAAGVLKATWGACAVLFTK